MFPSYLTEAQAKISSLITFPFCFTWLLYSKVDMPGSPRSRAKRPQLKHCHSSNRSTSKSTLPPGKEGKPSSPASAISWSVLYVLMFPLCHLWMTTCPPHRHTPHTHVTTEQIALFGYTWGWLILPAWKKRTWTRSELGLIWSNSCGWNHYSFYRKESQSFGQQWSAGILTA